MQNGHFWGVWSDINHIHCVFGRLIPPHWTEIAFSKQFELIPHNSLLCHYCLCTLISLEAWKLEGAHVYVDNLHLFFLILFAKTNLYHGLVHILELLCEWFSNLFVLWVDFSSFFKMRRSVHRGSNDTIDFCEESIQTVGWMQFLFSEVEQGIQIHKVSITGK